MTVIDPSNDVTYHIIELALLGIIAVSKAFEKLIDRLSGKVSPFENLNRQVADVRHELRNFVNTQTYNLDQVYARKSEVDKDIEHLNQRVDDLNGKK